MASRCWCCLPFVGFLSSTLVNKIVISLSIFSTIHVMHEAVKVNTKKTQSSADFHVLSNSKPLWRRELKRLEERHSVPIIQEKNFPMDQK